MYANISYNIPTTITFITNTTTKTTTTTIGQWNCGKMEGAGLLQCSNGDVYEGSFLNNLYEGIGSFRNAKGDVYMG